MKANPILLSIRARLWKQDQNWIGAFVGQTGSGKSYSAMRFAELIDRNFSADKVFFRIRDFIKAVHEKKIKRGDCVVIDEAGIGWGARSFMMQENKDMSALFQAVRFMNFGIILTVPSLHMVDRHGRDLLHATGRTLGINRTRGYVKLQYKMQEADAITGHKVYRKYPRIRQPNGQLKRITFIKVHKPSEKLIREYEKRKKIFAMELFSEIDKRMEKEEEKKTPLAPNVKCSKCGYEWPYKGRLKRIRCISCHGLVDVEEKPTNT